MAQTEQDVLIRIIQSDTGFYWTISVDENGQFVPAGEETTLIGPFPSHAAAFIDARLFIEDAIQEQEPTQ